MSDAEDPSLALPRPWASCQEERTAFHQALSRAPAPLLICDYDGTLAPFHRDKMQAVPYAGVAERLAAIAGGPTRLAFVSGRPVEELITLLPLAGHLELWGMHGRQHRTLDGQITLLEPTGLQREALDTAEKELSRRGLGDLLERKIASVALHWRALEGNPSRLNETRAQAEEAFAPYANDHSLALLPFDGGLELRATGHTKGHAVAALLAGAVPAASAFLGDDTTDEDGFQAMRAQGGLALLVRDAPRPSDASFSIHPPGELLDFLDTWQQALALSSRPQQHKPVH